MTVWLIGCHRGGQPGAVAFGETEVTVTNRIYKHTLGILRSPDYKDVDWAQAVDDNIHEWDAINNNVRSGDTVIIPHLNAANSDGTEMYVLKEDNVSYDLANKLQNMTVSTLGTRSRGVKVGTDYRSSYYTRQLGANGVLAEICFIDSQSDMAKLNANIARLGEQLARVIIEQSGGTWKGGNIAPAPKPTPQPKPQSWGDKMIGMKIGNETIDLARDEIGGLTWFEFTTGNNPIFPTLEDAINGTNASSTRLEVGDQIQYWGVIRTDKYTYLVYDRDNGEKGHVIFKNRTTGDEYGEILPDE